MHNPVIYKHISKRTNKLYIIYINDIFEKNMNMKINNYKYFSNLWKKNYKSTVTRINA